MWNLLLFVCMGYFVGELFQMIAMDKTGVEAFKSGFFMCMGALGYVVAYKYSRYLMKKEQKNQNFL